MEVPQRKVTNRGDDGAGTEEEVDDFDINTGKEEKSENYNYLKDKNERA